MSYYPDTATFTTLTGGGIDPETGYPVEPTENMVTLTGRMETGINDELIKVADAQSFAPSFVFYMPHSMPNVPVGSVITVSDYSSGKQYSGKVQADGSNKARSPMLQNKWVLCSNS